MRLKYLYIIPCCLLVVVIKISSSWGLADIENHKVRAAIEQWKGDVGSFSEEDWDKIYLYSKKSLDKDPDNPELLSLIGNVYELSSLLTEHELQNNQNRKLALYYYRKSVELRPQWPYVWSDIALLKYRMADFDEEFHNALMNASLLGPWEPRIQNVIAEIGLNLWVRLEQSQRLLIIKDIRRGIIMQPLVMLNLLKKYDQLRMVCHEKNKQAVVDQYCEKNFEA